MLAARNRGALRSWTSALRPHQWSKNVLLFLPALAAHLPWTTGLAATLLLAIATFSALASAVYLINDLVDLPHDRLHQTKRRRPIAAGDLSIPSALVGVVTLLAFAGAIALALPLEFRLTLLAYLCLSVTYSLLLKQLAIVDVLALAALYACRLIAGAAAVAVPLSRWFLAFSVFFFFSLALVKRTVELRSQSSRGQQAAAGRGYTPADLPILTMFGTATAAAAALVYCLYITSDDIGLLYSRPDLLWVGLPILLYWQARVWLLAERHQMAEDPVVFALRDRASHLLLACFLIAVWLAA